MKRLMSFAMVIGLLVGCESPTTKKTELISQHLTDRESHLMTLTGNRVLLYTLTNLPANSGYEVSLTYEVYDSGEKVKEEPLISLLEPEGHAESIDHTIGLNILENKIRTLSAWEGSSVSGALEIEEDLFSYGQTYYSNDMAFPLGTETYIFYATSSSSIAATLGVPLDQLDMNELLDDHETIILIKLSFLPYPN